MKLLRKIILILFFYAGLLVLLFGPRAQFIPPAGRTVVTYWEKWTGNEAAQMQQIVDDFNNSVGREKGIFVRYLSISDVNKKTLIAAAAGVPPDIAGLWDNNTVQFATSDALEPLEDLAAAAGLRREHYKSVYYDACQYNGHLWCLPSTPMAAALLWNKRI